MDMNHCLPFKVEQQAESRCFQSGFRGAWFRCKIKNISSSKGQIGHSLEFFDFPDEKISWTKLYQRPPTERAISRGERKLQLMVRPCFPPFFRQSQMPDLLAISEVVAIVDDAWMVGDLVDWWADGCYWSGRVIHVLGDDKVQIELPEPPIGEGRTYEAFCKDLRPSLDWTPEYGWTVPISRENESSRYCARLIQPLTHGLTYNLHPYVFQLHVHHKHRPSRERPSIKITYSIGSRLERKEGPNLGVAAPCAFEGLSSSYGSATSLPSPARSLHPQDTLRHSVVNAVNKEETHTSHESINLNLEDSGIGKASCSDKASSPHDRATETSGKMMGILLRKDRYSSRGSSKKLRISENEYVTSMMGDTIESSILDLEELASKIKWIKDFLQFGFRFSNAMNPSWKFFEHQASFTKR